MAAPFSLLVLTDAYPFGHSENFFETELETLRQFTEVIVVPSQRCDRSAPPLTPPDNVRAFIEPTLGKSKAIARLFRMVSVSPALTVWLTTELRSRRDVWLEPRGLYLLAWFIWHALRTFTDAEAAMKRYSLEPSRTVVYAYWSWPSALSALLLKAKYPSLATIARCHGGDVYEERHTPAYLPFRPLFASQLDRVAFISEHGRSYFAHRWSAPPERLILARLGVSSAPARSIASYGADRSRPLEIVSCSFAVSVKRIPLMLETIRLLAQGQPATRVRWTHLGDGPMLPDLKKRIAVLREPNLEVRLVGHVDPSAVIEHYVSNPVDVFLNTSENEGVPVSMMEAMSCGIPVVGPLVGGVPEIVSGSNGALVPVTGTANDFARAVLSCVEKVESHQLLREGAFARWAAEYRADNNFSRFFEALKVLHDERSKRLREDRH